MGTLAGRFRRFPLLLKFLDAREMLSVQVHPADTHTDLLPPRRDRQDRSLGRARGGAGRPRIYAGLKPGTTEVGLRRALHERRSRALPRMLHSEARGRCCSCPAGTVHSLGGDIVVFEVQQNSDVTFRLYDWDYVDGETGQSRALQLNQALACIDLGRVLAVC